jgi:vacuolar-type H+-ATPase subunit E/Vma4
VKSAESNSGEVLCQEILAEARHARDEILRRAQQDAEAIVAQAHEKAEKIKQEHLAQACEEADRRRVLILATVPVEAGRLRATRVEALLQSVFDEARSRLAARDEFDYPGAVMALATEAVSQMVGDALVVKLSPVDRNAFGETLVSGLKQLAARPSLAITLADDPAITKGGGVIVEDAQRQQSWDNRLPSRLQRLWPELGRQIAMQTALVGTKAQSGVDA